MRFRIHFTVFESSQGLLRHLQDRLERRFGLYLICALVTLVVYWAQWPKEAWDITFLGLTASTALAAAFWAFYQEPLSLRRYFPLVTLGGVLAGGALGLALLPVVLTRHDELGLSLEQQHLYVIVLSVIQVVPAMYSLLRIYAVHRDIAAEQPLD